MWTGNNNEQSMHVLMSVMASQVQSASRAERITGLLSEWKYGPQSIQHVSLKTCEIACHEKVNPPIFVPTSPKILTPQNKNH